MKSVLITGVTGYIGSHLAQVFLPECKVYGLTREPLNTEYIIDIADNLNLMTYDGTYASVVTALERSKPDLVYHLATFYSGSRGKEITPKLLASNITYGAYLLDAMAECGCNALVNATSVMTCSTGNGYCPQNLYAATKQAFFDLLTYYTDARLLRAVTLMLSDTYGPEDCRPKILNLIKNAASCGEHIALSDGTQDYDVVFIDDVVEAFWLAGERALLSEMGTNETFQIAADHPLSLRKTVELMQKLTGLTFDAGWGERQTSPREICKAIRVYPMLPGWRQKVRLEEGLKML